MITEGLDTPHVAAERTIGKHLHCIELWMPGKCNLACRHCYVASRDFPKPLSQSSYKSITQEMIRSGFVDVVIPGMEPLLRRELWSVLSAAQVSNARSVGLTTNGTLLSKHAQRLADSSLTVLNVSIDGLRSVHDSIRGDGVFDRVRSGVKEFRRLSNKRLLSNTTVHAINADSVTSIARFGADHGFDYAAFHPFETADDAENSLQLSNDKLADTFEHLINEFDRGRLPSIVLEAESSTLGVMLELARRGIFSCFDLVIDEAGFLFLRRHSSHKQLLVSLMFYPHHFVRTIRITDNGGISSCRSMAERDWHGIGDIRTTSIRTLLTSPLAINALSKIWSEFSHSLLKYGKDEIHTFLDSINNLATTPAAVMGA